MSIAATSPEICGQTISKLCKVGNGAPMTAPSS